MKLQHYREEASAYLYDLRCSEAQVREREEQILRRNQELQEATNKYLSQKELLGVAQSKAAVDKATIESANKQIMELLEGQKKLTEMEAVQRERKQLADLVETKNKELEEMTVANSNEVKTKEIKSLRARVKELEMKLSVTAARASLSSVSSEDSSAGELTSFMEIERFMNSRMRVVWDTFRYWWATNKGPEDFTPTLNIIQRDRIRRAMHTDRDKAVSIMQKAARKAASEVEEMDIYKGLTPAEESSFWNRAIKMVGDGHILYNVPPLSSSDDLALNSSRHLDAAKFFLLRLQDLKADFRVYFRGEFKGEAGPDRRVQKDSQKNEVKTRMINWYHEVQTNYSSVLGRDNVRLRELCEAAVQYTTVTVEKLVEALDLTKGSTDKVAKWCLLYDAQWVVALSLVTLWTGKHQFTKLFHDMVKSWGPCRASTAQNNSMPSQVNILRAVTTATPATGDSTWEIGLARHKEHIVNELAVNPSNRLASCLVYLLDNSHRLSGTALLP